MGRTHLLLIPFLLRLGAPVAAQDEWQPYKCPPLEFDVSIPKGWNAQQDRTGMVAQSPGAGFSVSREPFLHGEKEFPKAWAAQLDAGGFPVEVKKTRVGSYDAYRAAWTAKGGRFVEVWRVHVPLNEMLYNFSFSATDEAALKPLIATVLKSFRVTAKPPSLAFQREEVSLMPQVTMRAPEGYAMSRGGVRLGGGLARAFIRTLPGYEKPHVAGVLAATVKLGQTKKLAEAQWDDAEPDFAKVLKKPRVKSAKYNDIKGHKLEALVLSKAGLPQRYLVFVGRVKQVNVMISALIDDREARMYGDYLKLVCEQIKQ